MGCISGTTSHLAFAHRLSIGYVSRKYCRYAGHTGHIVEIGTALSAVVLGLCVALALKPPFVIAAIIIGVFAVFHGHSHGTELPEATNAYSYAAGFVIATSILHFAGISFGLVKSWDWGKHAARATGAAIALAGIAFLTGAARAISLAYHNLPSS